MSDTITGRVNFAAFIELAKKQQRDLNEKSVPELNTMLATDQTGLVMGAIEERAYFEYDAREQSSDEWTRGHLIAAAEWALPRNEY
jgi:hypothetical protein